jgi:predicted ATPase
MSARGQRRYIKYGLEPVTLEQTEHFRLIREFCADPAGFLETRLDEPDEG